MRNKNSVRRLELTGQKFGKLTALYLNEEKTKNSNYTYWHCICDCGNEIDILLNNLTRPDRTPSCGCLHMKSRGEEKIKTLLKEYNIPFTTEQSFVSCVNPKTGKKLRFDFFVNESYLIEYNGKQHYIEDDGWDEPLEDIQYRDNIKI